MWKSTMRRCLTLLAGPNAASSTDSPVEARHSTDALAEHCKESQSLVTMTCLVDSALTETGRLFRVTYCLPNQQITVSSRSELRNMVPGEVHHEVATPLAVPAASHS